jgi:hypothetical protein
MEKRKIAIIGNMNNNGFAMMRHMREIGFEADLLLYSNDGIGNSSHFSIDSDTWDLDKWKQFVKRTGIADHPLAVLKGIFGKVVITAYNLIKKNDRNKVISKTKKEEIEYIFDEYDIIFASGIAPAVFSIFGKSVDVFFHYSDHIEYINSSWSARHINGSNKIKSVLYDYVRKIQYIGLSRASYIYSSNFDSAQILLKHNKNVIITTYPMIYPEQIRVGLISDAYKKLIKEHKNILKIFSHSRIRWKYDPSYDEDEWFKESKGTDILLNGFASFLAAGYEGVLYIVEYGSDVDETKNLVLKLGIQKNIVWLPKMARKELLEYIKVVDIACGEFTLVQNMLWGSTALEVMSTGTPLMQAINFDRESFLSIYGMDLPPVFDAKSTSDVVSNFKFIVENKYLAKEIGERAKKWFDDYYGKKLSERWLSKLVNNSSEEILTTKITLSQ